MWTRERRIGRRGFKKEDREKWERSKYNEKKRKYIMERSCREWNMGERWLNQSVLRPAQHRVHWPAPGRFRDPLLPPLPGTPKLLSCYFVLRSISSLPSSILSCQKAGNSSHFSSYPLGFSILIHTSKTLIILNECTLMNRWMNEKNKCMNYTRPPWHGTRISLLPPL